MEKSSSLYTSSLDHKAIKDSWNSTFLSGQFLRISKEGHNFYPLWTYDSIDFLQEQGL